MGKRVKLSLINNGSISAVFGNIIEEEPLKIEFDNVEIFKNYDIIIFPYITQNSRRIFFLDTIAIEENIIEFKFSKDISDVFFKYNFIEFNHNINVVKIADNQKEKYIQLSNKLNIQEHNSTANRLKEVYSRDDIENRELISFLIDINAKIDEILYLLKPKVNIDGSKEYTSIILGEEGIFFISREKIESSNIMIHSTIRDSGGFFSFASVCHLEEFSKCNEFIIYKAVFENINNDTEDKIIKYIFRFEREMLKEANK